jgi:hypothetical protein
MYLEELANWIDEQAFDFVYWNMMHEAYYFSVATLPDDAKVKAQDRLRHAQVSAWHRAEFERICDFMSKGASLDGQILRMKIRDLDWKRGTDLALDHPELAQAIGYCYHD